MGRLLERCQLESGPKKRRRNCRRDLSAEITDSFIDWNEWRVAGAFDSDIRSDWARKR